jgi:hypothetical protein
MARPKSKASILGGLTAAERKAIPVSSACIDYFPNALVEVARVSLRGSKQHHPDKPCHWDRGKSADEADALIRHFLARGEIDDDGLPHSAKLAWRALALLQKELEERHGLPISRGSSK